MNCSFKSTYCTEIIIIIIITSPSSVCLLPPCVSAHFPMILWAFPSIAPAASQHQGGKEEEEEVVVLDS